MNFYWNSTPMPDQLAENQDVLDDDLHCTFVNPLGSHLGANHMRPQGHVQTQQRYNTVTSHRTQPSVGPPMSGDSPSSADHNRRNFTQGQYSTQPVSTSISQVLAIPPPQIDYCTTTNMLPNYDSWNNVSTLHSTQYHNPVLGGASIGHSSSPAIGSGYFSPPTSQKVYPNGPSSHSIISSQYTITNNPPFVFDPNMSTSDFSPYNTSPHQWQTHTVPQPGPLSLPLTPVIPPPQAAESSHFSFVMQPHAVHGEQMGYPLNQPPINQPFPSPLHSHPSSPLMSCQWLSDAAIHCGFIGTLKALESHCKIVHLSGPRIAQIECHWEGCDYHSRDDPAVRVMRRDCIWRHICEVHLRLKRGRI
ncbi:uncharacterized protein F5891DRAFT_1235449 [Suillus fuscotomentosus]|uniref:Uncharacterized protein n=1 Tax=Suillus fuscotomentosus TaxID=1912939 RepID=A0AAD4HKR3_9AGAM|nr:uncharacterized protein F5891DRAFT_1235449 [Suillus fuscotomentosus]KAG1899054.1 hypothetical protein F5891DRAFT_1235449 [Suillus fuscotomentosus]